MITVIVGNQLRPKKVINTLTQVSINFSKSFDAFSWMETLETETEAQNSPGEYHFAAVVLHSMKETPTIEDDGLVKYPQELLTVGQLEVRVRPLSNLTAGTHNNNVLE